MEFGGGELGRRLASAVGQSVGHQDSVEQERWSSCFRRSHPAHPAHLHPIHPVLKTLCRHRADTRPSLGLCSLHSRVNTREAGRATPPPIQYLRSALLLLTICSLCPCSPCYDHVVMLHHAGCILDLNFQSVAPAQPDGQTDHKVHRPCPGPDPLRRCFCRTVWIVQDSRALYNATQYVWRSRGGRARVLPACCGLRPVACVLP